MWEPTEKPAQEATGTSEDETYTVMFLQETVVEAQLQTKTDRPDRPAVGFAVKKGGAKRVTVTEQQKDIMIVFYNRQRSSNVRADPQNVISAMEQAGIQPLTKKQITAWWSTYHRKQKQLADDLLQDARQLLQLQGTFVCIQLSS